MSKHLVLLPGWGWGVVPLQILAEQLDAALAHLTVQVQPLPDMSGKNAQTVIQQLDQQLPSDCWLMGWSLGGMLATALAAHRQSACAGVISYASNASFVAHETWPQAMSAATFAEFRELCQGDLPAALKRFALLCSQGTIEPRALARQLLATAVLGDAASAVAGLDVLAELDNRVAISEFAGPQLHLLAQDDGLVPSAVANSLSELNPQASVELLGKGHAGLIAEPQRLAQHIASFILSGQYA